MKKGRAGTMTHDYQRHGTRRCSPPSMSSKATSSAATSQRHRHQEFIRFFNAIEAEVPARQADPCDRRQLRHPQAPEGADMARQQPLLDLPLHPDFGSWLNAVEGFFAKLTRRTVGDLPAAINRFGEETNADPKPFIWTANPNRVLAAAWEANVTLNPVI